MPMLTVEDVILQKSARGMERLRPYLPADFCRRAAAALLSLERGNVLLTTGFYVAGHAESDGPPGTLFLARALHALGFACTVVTDAYCRGYFDGEDVRTEYVAVEADESDYEALLAKYCPQALIAVERCGVNADGDYANMRGESIAAHTARMNLLFEAGRRRGILTVGVGDGGNEIGMGQFRSVIQRELGLTPCVNEVDYPVIATVSNWGCYGLCACLQSLTGEKLLPAPDEVNRFLEKMTARGSVDGVTRRHTATVDGFPMGTEAEIIKALEETLF